LTAEFPFFGSLVEAWLLAGWFLVAVVFLFFLRQEQNQIISLTGIDLGW